LPGTSSGPSWKQAIWRSNSRLDAGRACVGPHHFISVLRLFGRWASRLCWPSR
jgi:hypothetical protein